MTTAKYNRSRRAFTLVEVLFVAVIMALVAAAVLDLYIFPFRVWYNNTALWMLTVHGKTIREKMLCGVDRNDAGLRAAILRTVECSHEAGTNTDRLDYDVDMLLPPTVDVFSNDLHCALRFSPTVGLALQTPPDTGPLVSLNRRLTNVGNLTFSLNNSTRVLTAQVDLKARNYKGGYITYPVTIQTYINNE